MRVLLTGANGFIGARGDGQLKGLDLGWVLLRPSLIYGEGACGGMAMLRALAEER